MSVEGQQENNAGELITPEQRQDFLNLQGWQQASPDERAEIESTWTDAKIHMAIELNL